MNKVLCFEVGMEMETEHIVYQGLLLKFYHYLGKNGNRNSKHGNDNGFNRFSDLPFWYGTHLSTVFCLYISHTPVFLCYFNISVYMCVQLVWVVKHVCQF
jgi:hypothetical protein